MRVSFVSTSRLPNWPWWAVAMVAVWLGLVGLATVMSERTGSHVDLCAFKRLTTLPCPTCGTTRGVLCFLHGRPLDAFAMNPLVFAALAVVAASLIFRAATGKKIVFNLSRRQRIVAWILLGITVAANWAYVIVCVG